MIDPINFGELKELASQADNEETQELSLEDVTYYGQTATEYGATVTYPTQEQVNELNEGALKAEIASLKLAIETKDKQIALLAGLDAEETKQEGEYKPRLRNNKLNEPLPSVQWLIKERLHAVGVLHMFAESGAGKTLFMLDLALSIATGQKECIIGKLRTEGPQPVFYAAMEGGQVFRQYINGWLLGHPDVDPELVNKNFYQLDGAEGHSLDVGIPGKAQSDFNHAYEGYFIKEVDDLIEEGIKPAMVIFDTQVDIATHADENSNDDMIALFGRLSKDANLRNTLYAVIHHTGAGDQGRSRGATAPRGKSDDVISLKKTSNKEVREFTFIKIKGYEDGMSEKFFIRANEVVEKDSEGLDVYEDGKLSYISLGFASKYQADNPSDFAAVHIDQNYYNEVRKVQVAIDRSSKGYINNGQFSDAIGLNRRETDTREYKVNSMIKDGYIRNESENKNARYVVANYLAPENGEDAS